MATNMDSSKFCRKRRMQGTSNLLAALAHKTPTVSLSLRHREQRIPITAFRTFEGQPR